MSENKRGKPERWENDFIGANSKSFHCDICEKSIAEKNLYFTKDKEYYACPSCYQTHVVEPSEGVKKCYYCGGEPQYTAKLSITDYVCEGCRSNVPPGMLVEPLTPALEPLKEWSDDLVGKRVVCLCHAANGSEYIEEGEQHTISSCSRSGRLIYLEEKDLPFVLGRFALSPSQPGQEEGEMKKKDIRVKMDVSESLDKLRKAAAKMGNDMRKAMQKGGFGMPGNLLNTDPQPITEVTHSCTLEFPNGDIVEIPGPGDGWEDISLTDKEPDPNAWQSRVENVAGNNSRQLLLTDSNRDEFEVKHKAGRLIVYEYLQRIYEEEPELHKLTKHTRTYTPTVEVDTVHEALSAFPLLNGVK